MRIVDIAMVRVTLVISSLDAGGAERVASTMANHWARGGHPVTVVTFSAPSRAPFYTLDPRVRRMPLGVAGRSRSLATAVARNLNRARLVRRAIRQSRPDAVVSFLDATNVVTLLATRGLSVPVVVTEHRDPFLHQPGRAWGLLRRLTYPWADRVVVLNDRARGYFPGGIRARTRVIPNPVVVDGDAGASDPAPFPRPALASMGRLVEEKGHDLLLRAFARLGPRFSAWHLVVLGEGPWRGRLESLRETLGLGGRVSLPGAVRDPHRLLRQADLFALPSREEAFPMALCEAMACGLPVVVAEYHDAVREIVRDGVDGLVVPREDVEALAAALGRLMADPAERARLGGRGVEILGRFGLEPVMAAWDTLLEELR